MTGVRNEMMRWLTIAVFAVGLTACVGHVGESGDESPSIEHAFLLDLDPAGEVAARVWMDAPQSCEGQLEAVETWTLHYAEGAPSLGVIIDENGDAVCVDNWSSIREELERAMGDPSPDPMLPVLDEAMP